MTEPIRIVDYDPAWPARFAAKPIIDILVGVSDLESGLACRGRLEALDYLYAPYRADEEVWFCKPDPERRTHHLHLVPAGSEHFQPRLTFRDRLRADRAVAADYEALKRELAERHRTDREAYTEAKSEFVAAVLRSKPA